MAVGLDLDQYHFVKRVVLVFSPSARDVHYEEQRLYLEDDTGEADSWNLEVFGIFEEGPSFAAERALSREEAQAARERFGVDEGNFALYLLDLDGTSVLRSDEPVPLDQLIDAIPE
jgi:hypothetical protein